MSTPPSPHARPRPEWLHAAAVGVALFVLYALTSPRTVALEDDGLFVLSSYFLGVEHPPGYPLFTLIGHLFSKLPFGEVAYRVHLASAMFGALTGAVLWLCTRCLTPGRVPAYLAALGLGLSPVFWSQAIIAEVYTLNTFFFLLLVYLGLRACPPGSDLPAPRGERFLPWIALIFGLSLSNHWPLMLLVAPSFVVLLWPLREAVLQRAGLLVLLAAAGLLPYAWMVVRSWATLPINFDGPLETIPEVLFFVSRAGYAGVDQSASATWLDRVRFFEFQGEQLFVQFAVAGTLLAIAGFVAQWRTAGRRVSTFLTAAFLMPTAVLLLLLGFDYDAMRKHIYHVYPLPAYAVCALWMAIGLRAVQARYRLGERGARALAGAVLALVAGAGAYLNLSQDDEWGARYAKTLLALLPQNAVVFAQGDADLAPMAYFHMIQGQRPDITLYHAQGLVLGNRLFHPLRTREEDQRKIIHKFIEEAKDPVVFTLDSYTGFARVDRWLFRVLDKSSTDPAQVKVDIPPEARAFFAEWISDRKDANAWIAGLQGELRRTYAVLIARSLPPRGSALDEQTRRDLELLSRDFYGALGLAQGLVLNPHGYPAGVVYDTLEKARMAMPSDVNKVHLARYFYLRGALRASKGERDGAIRDFETSVSVYPPPDNPAVDALRELYRETGNSAALAALEQRQQRFHKRLP
ncbi:MAG TPA: DUF2723 domain-containing protein [Burkholderiales bacterium]